MKKIRLLHIEFDATIEPWELTAFRSAVIEVTGRKHLLFHNHLNDSFLYKYPLIQYKRIGKRPAILCIDQGVDELHHFFDQKGEVVLLGTKEIELKVARLNLNQYVMQVWANPYHYRINNWIALNEENYLRYQALDGLIEKIGFLESTLKANILALAKGIEWTVEKPIELKIKQLNEPKIIRLKQTKFMTFNALFDCNVFLPNFIGLGKSVSKGFGVVSQLKERS